MNNSDIKKIEEMTISEALLSLENAIRNVNDIRNLLIDFSMLK